MDEIVWTPEFSKNNAMWQYMQFINNKYNKHFSDYQSLYEWSISNSALFWDSLCLFFNMRFDTPGHEILNQFQHMMNARWFSGATLNFAEKLLSRRDEHPALVCLDEENRRTVLTYQQLYLEVAQCAAGLKALGVGIGDRVAALLPNTFHTIVAMLATTSLGAIWSSCSPDFGAQATIDRIGQIEPKVLFVCDGHRYQGKRYPGQTKIHQLENALPSLNAIIVCPTINEPIHTQSIPKAIYWHDFIQTADKCHFISLPFNHPVYILFSSGTTGKPKCIVHGAGGTLLQHLKELGLHCNLSNTDNLCFYTTAGWMMWNWTVSALALGATLTLYEGSPTYPDADQLFQMIEKEKVTVLGTSAKYISSIEKLGVQPKVHRDLKTLRLILSTGSPLLPKNYDFIYEHVKTDVQLSSISGGTDIISCFALGNPMLPVYKGELQCRGLGMAVEIFNEEGQSVRNERGELVCTKPFPSMPVGFWNDPNQSAYQHAYFDRFPDVWAHGDFAEITEHNGVIIYGRSDAVLNPGGVRIGTAEIYRQVEKIEEVIESIVIGQDWQDDVRIVLFVKLREGLSLNPDLVDKIKKIIRQNASPRHVPAKILQVSDIPRTMSGKIVEIAVRQVVHGHHVNNLQSLANPQALDYFKNRDELLT